LVNPQSLNTNLQINRSKRGILGLFMYDYRPTSTLTAFSIATIRIPHS
jgi:hypothetical protein